MSSEKLAASASEHFTRRIVLPMAAMITIAIVMVVSFLVVTAEGQNKIAVDVIHAAGRNSLAGKTARNWPQPR